MIIRKSFFRYKSSVSSLSKKGFLALINLLSLFAKNNRHLNNSFCHFSSDLQAKKKEGYKWADFPNSKKDFKNSQGEQFFFFNQNYKKRLIVTKAWKEPLESRKPPTECLDRVLFEENLPYFFNAPPVLTYYSYPLFYNTMSY